MSLAAVPATMYLCCWANLVYRQWQAILLPVSLSTSSGPAASSPDSHSQLLLRVEALSRAVTNYFPNIYARLMPLMQEFADTSGGQRAQCQHSTRQSCRLGPSRRKQGGSLAGWTGHSASGLGGHLARPRLTLWGQHLRYDTRLRGCASACTSSQAHVLHVHMKYLFDIHIC